MTDTSARSTSQANDKIDPSRAPASLDRWRRAVANAMGSDPGVPLDQPDRRLLMLRVFGSTRRLSELCMTFPTAAASVLTEGPSPVLAEAARDLSRLSNGVGGPEALHNTLAPLKNRADIAISLAELGGAWSVLDATAARVDFAERLVDTALHWMVRAAVKRGELAAPDAENILRGVYVLAGGDFAHEDLSPYGPLELVIVHDEAVFDSAARGADRVFVRIGAELREVFEGKPGEYPLYALSTPFGSGVSGAGYSESADRIQKIAEGPQSGPVRRWLATARVVAGDRTAGGQFLERVEPAVWGGETLLTESLRTSFEKASGDHRAVFRNIANLCRYAIGGARPRFRTASAQDIIQASADSGAITQDCARRLIAGDEFAHIAVSRTQMIKGFAVGEMEQDDERSALSLLCGYPDHTVFDGVLNGVILDASSTLRRIMRGPQDEISIYNSDSNELSDADKLADLGFFNGEGLSEAVDNWTRSLDGDHCVKRFSEVAPGLLTAFGETQHPNTAVQLFDRLISQVPGSLDLLKAMEESDSVRDGVIDALGCFGRFIEPLTVKSDAAIFVNQYQEDDCPQSVNEWFSKYPLPAVDDAFEIETLSQWRCEIISRIVFCLATGDLSFDLADETLIEVQARTLHHVFCGAQKTAPKQEERNAGQAIALHLFDRTGGWGPDVAQAIGLIAQSDQGEHGEAFARHFLELVGKIGQGVFTIPLDLSHRPGGTAGPLAPDSKSFSSFAQTEAVASQQMIFARSRVIAGDSAPMEAAREALRSASSGARRADMLYRDLDRARSQQMRRDRPNSEWDVDRIDGGRHDVDLIISALFYKHAPSHSYLQEGTASDALDGMARAGLISNECAQSLKAAQAFWARLQLVRTLAGWDDPVRTPVRSRFSMLIARAAGVEKFDQVRPLMRGYADEVSRHYSQFILGRPPLSVVESATA